MRRYRLGSLSAQIKATMAAVKALRPPGPVFRIFAVAALFMALCAEASASNLTLAGDDRWVVIASGQDVSEAIDFAKTYANHKPSVLKSENGWYAIVLGPYRTRSINSFRSSYSGPALPSDAYLALGKNFVSTAWSAGGTEGNWQFGTGADDCHVSSDGDDFIFNFDYKIEDDAYSFWLSQHTEWPAPVMEAPYIDIEVDDMRPWSFVFDVSSSTLRGDLNLSAESLDVFVEEFSHGQTMAITVPGDPAHMWKLKLRGSRAVGNRFKECVSQLKSTRR